MKYILILITVVLFSCKGQRHQKVVVDKSYRTFMGNKMPNCICRYYYKEYENIKAQEFEDSCYKYNIGDTIK